MYITIILLILLILFVLLSIPRNRKSQPSFGWKEMMKDATDGRSMREMQREYYEKHAENTRKSHREMMRMAGELERLERRGNPILHSSHPKLEMRVNPASHSSRPELTAGDDYIDGEFTDAPPRLGSGR